MLEIKHLTKIYKTKGGADVKALDDVSISFGETGLVFLLGKSGSGKSTLLNLAGGLDEPTDGEVIVKGKSSKEFTGSDFDSYRNTFVGFVFQEYNVLNEFSVEDNVALALELQGKPKDREKINEILKSVELEGFAKRKPNTLSGGQKQRIAIARALVKDPQIIMADEPTGALDSATGKQVFDSLKKLSETRLVIVVSHDREFAEVYGDRIVELKDGRIISDEIKKKVIPVEVDGNVSSIGGDTISIKCGKEVTKESLKIIEDFICGAEGDIILTKGKKELSDFRRAVRIDENGAREHFEETKESELSIKKYEKGEARFIRSRLPAGKAMRIGVSSLKLKPFRLILTILLSVIAFTMFGLSSTMTLYDGDEVLKSSLMQNDSEYMVLSKRYYSHVRYFYGKDRDEMSYDRVDSARFTPEELKICSDKYGYAVGTYSFSAAPENIKVSGDDSGYYQTAIYTVAVSDEGSPLRNKITAGKYPAAKDEIAVSTYLVECAENGVFCPVADDGSMSGSEKQINAAEDLIGEKIIINSKAFKISGVFDSGKIPSRFENVRDGGLISLTYAAYLHEQMHNAIFVTEEFIEDNYDYFRESEQEAEYFDYAEKSIEFYYSADEDKNVDYSSCQVKVYDGSDDTQMPVTFFGEEKNSLGDKEIILNAEWLTTDDRHFSIEREKLTDEELYEFGVEYNNYCSALETVRQGTVFEEIYDSEGNITDASWREATEEEIAAARKIVVEFLNKYWDKKIDIIYYGWDSETGDFVAETDEGYTVVGFYESVEDSAKGYYCSEYIYDKAEVYATKTIIETKYEKEEDAKYDSIFIYMDKSRGEIEGFLSSIGTDNINAETDVFYALSNNVVSLVETASEVVGVLSTVFLCVGIVLAIFSALLLFNFISMSITNKKKEIGILRAVGARGVDVFKIFFSESGVIVGICAALAIIGSIIIAAAINNTIKTQLGLNVTLFVLGVPSIAIMLCMAASVAVVATFLPVFFASRKKPVESIRAL